MTVTDAPLWMAIIIATLVVLGSGISLLGASGLLRLNSFYDRVHAPTLGATLGMALVLTASWLYFGITQGRWLPREVLIAVFLTVTTPVTLIMLARAAVFRDRTGDGETGDKPVPSISDPVPEKTVAGSMNDDVDPHARDSATDR